MHITKPKVQSALLRAQTEKAWTQTAATTREDATGPSKRKTGARFGCMHSVVTLISRITPTSLAINFATKDWTVTQLARHRAGVVSTRGQSPPACFLNPTICAVELPSEAANSRAPSQPDSALHNSTVAQALRLAATGRNQESPTGVATRPPPLQPPRLHAQSESLSKPFPSRFVSTDAGADDQRNEAR